VCCLYNWCYNKILQGKAIDTQNNQNEISCFQNLRFAVPTSVHCGLSLHYRSASSHVHRMSPSFLLPLAAVGLHSTGSAWAPVPSRFESLEPLLAVTRFPVEGRDHYHSCPYSFSLTAITSSFFNFEYTPSRRNARTHSVYGAKTLFPPHTYAESSPYYAPQNSAG